MTKIQNIRLDPSVQDWLRSESGKRGLGIAEIVRRLLVSAGAPDVRVRVGRPKKEETLVCRQRKN